MDVGLLSGRTTAVKADLNEEVGTLKLGAQTALGVGMGGWWTYLEAALDGSSTITAAEWWLADLTHKSCSSSTRQMAFATIFCDGTVATWGDACELERGERAGSAEGCASKPLGVHSLPFLETGPSSPWVVTVVLCRISWRMCSRFKPLDSLGCHSWPWIRRQVATVGLCGVSCAILEDGSVVT